MSMINYASREINCKIVYYGPGLGGKTTNLEHVYGKVNPTTRGKLISLATETERTLSSISCRSISERFAASRPASICTRCPARCTTTPAGSSFSRESTGSSSSPTHRSSEWRPIRSRCRTCMTTWRNTGTTSRACPSSCSTTSATSPMPRTSVSCRRALNPGWEISDPQRQRVTPDPYHAGENLVDKYKTGEWVERAPYFEAVAVTGEGVFETLKAVSQAGAQDVGVDS